MPKNKAFYDVGANAGYFSVLARRVAPNIPLVLFEPDPDNIASTKQNLALNNLDDYQHAVVNYLQDCETATYSSWTPAATAILDSTSPSGNAGVNKRSVMHSAVFANISGGSIVGGIAGSVNEFTNSGVKNSYFEGTLTGSSSVGGIAGEGGIVEASFAAPQFTNGGTGIIGATKSASTAYSYASGFYVNNANAHGVGANYIEQTYGTGSVNFGWNAGATAYTFHSWYKGDLAARLMNTLGPNNSGGIVMDSWWEGVDTTDEGTLARICYSGFVQRVSLKGSVTAIHSGGSYWGGMCEVQQQIATVFRDTYIDIALTSGATGAWRPCMYVGRKVSGVVVIANSYSTGSINVAQGSGLSRIGDILENVFSTVTFPGTAWSIQAAFPSNATNVYGYIPAVAGPTACYQTTAGGSCATQTNTA